MKKVISGIFAFLPLVLVISAIILKQTFSYMDVVYEDAAVYKSITMIVLLLVAVITALVETIIYVIKAMKNPYIDGDMHMIWAICIIFFGMFAYPVYWFLHLRKNPVKK